MSKVFAMYRKEMRAYLVSPIPYLFTALFCLFTGWWFFLHTNFFLFRAASMEQFFVVVPWTFIFLVPALTMRSWSEELRGGTLETLLTLPATSTQLVLAKFLSALTLLAMCLLATLPIPITVSSLGDLDWGPVIGGYLGALLMGGALLAMGLWISAMTSHQIVAFLLASFASLGLVLMQSAAPSVGGGLGALFERVSVASRYQSLGRGVVDLRDVIYFATFMLFFLYLNTRAIENRRYR